ncbi:MAG TPA: fumarylacetoacetate hydrolase family protein [Candidatus Dormibacteraeota bacterium]
MTGHRGAASGPASTADDRITALAEALWKAEQSRRAIPPIIKGDPDLTVGDAYRIQLTNIKRKLAAGARIMGRKVGLTSRAMQSMMGVNEPDFGVLLDDMFVEEGDAVPVADLVQPRVEAEIALVLGRGLRGPGVSSTAALRCVESAVASIEIIDSRIEDWKIGLIDTIADNASSARFVVAARRTPVDGIDLRLTGMALSINGELLETGAGAAVLGNPARCLAWLANKLATFDEELEAGDIVLAGALHRAIPVKPGDSVVAEFDRLGSVRTRFT